jgi:hypothetical protein
MPSGKSKPIWLSEAASTIMIPPIVLGKSELLLIFLNGALNSTHTRLETLPKCKPQAIMLGLDAARDIAEPTVSISPFIPVITGTAPFEHAFFIQSLRVTSLSLTELAV